MVAVAYFFFFLFFKYAKQESSFTRQHTKIGHSSKYFTIFHNYHHIVKQTQRLDNNTLKSWTITVLFSVLADDAMDHGCDVQSTQSAIFQKSTLFFS